MTETEHKPNIEEIYITASTTSNLKVEADRPGSADILIAVGWSPSRLGGALSRLHTDWDKAEKPARVGKLTIERMVAAIKAQDAKDVQAAREERKLYSRLLRPQDGNWCFPRTSMTNHAYGFPA